MGQKAKCYSCPNEATHVVTWRNYKLYNVMYCEGCADGVCQQLDDEGSEFKVKVMPGSITVGG